MNKFNSILENHFIRNIEYESNIVFKKYNKVILKEYLKWINIFKKYKKFSIEVKKSIDIIINKPFFGFHSQGMRIIEPDRIIIKLWGINPSYLIHELTHCYFPSKNISFHEGLANYMQNLYYNVDEYEEKGISHNIKKIKINNLNNILQEILIVKKINNPLILYEIWSNYEYYNDTRCFNMFISRIISMLFVNFIIKKYSIEDYFNKFHYNIANLNKNNDLISLFYEFYYFNFNNEITVRKRIYNINKKYQYYNQKWKLFRKFNLPSTGNPMAYLKNCNINKLENKKAIKIYIKELKLFNKLLKICND